MITRCASGVTTCSFAVAPLRLPTDGARYEAAGGSGSVTVSCADGCEWAAASQVSWITLTAGASGTHQRQRGFQRRAESERAGTQRDAQRRGAAR